VSACRVTSGRLVREGGKGQAAPCVAVGRVNLRSLIECGESFSEAGQADEVLAMGDEEIDVLGLAASR